jgi:putative transposase
MDRVPGRGPGKESKTLNDVMAERYSAPWKIKLALRLRKEHGLSITWLAKHLNTGKASSLRSHICREKLKNQHATP